MFEFNEPYEQTEPNVIRSDFAELIAGYHPDDIEALLFKLACYLSTDTLREFMDDLAMGRVWTMKTAIETLTLCLMTVIVSSLTVYGALGVDPFAKQSPLMHQAKNNWSSFYHYLPLLFFSFHFTF